MENQEYLLNDEEMRRFIIDGYIKVQPDFPASFHETIFQQVEDMFENQGNLGNNLLPLIPEIQQVFSDPAVHGALTSALGRELCHALTSLLPLQSAGEYWTKFS